jgi:hypothetical protein
MVYRTQFLRFCNYNVIIRKCNKYNPEALPGLVKKVAGEENKILVNKGVQVSYVNAHRHSNR